MKEVFISYAREDQAKAARLASLVEAHGWEAWWDPHLSAGQAYDEEIQRHLQKADAVLVLWSTSSASSRWVKAEADVGMSRNVLIPAQLEEVNIPLPFHRLQTADLTGWSGQADHPGIAQIRVALERLESGRAPIPDLVDRLKPPAPARHLHKGWWLAGAGLVIVAVAGILLLLLGSESDESKPPEPGTMITVPDITGLRLDEARIPLTALGITGPSLRDVDGEPFPEDVGDLETITRVATVSPPPGTEVAYGQLDLTLYLEFCDGVCPPGG